MNVDLFAGEGAINAAYGGGLIIFATINLYYSTCANGWRYCQTSVNLLNCDPN